MKLRGLAPFIPLLLLFLVAAYIVFSLGRAAA